MSADEIQPLIDAFVSNSSLKHLDLTKARLKWDGEPDSLETPLLTQMANDESALSALETLKVNKEGMSLPVGRLRKGGDETEAALSEVVEKLFATLLDPEMSPK